MSRSLTRNLYLPAVALFIVAAVFGIVAAAGATTSTDAATGAVSVSGANGGLAALAVLLFVVGALLGFASWVGALIKTAQLGRWGWFVGILLASGIALLIYIFAGPTEKAAA